MHTALKTIVYTNEYHGAVILNNKMVADNIS